MSHSTPYDAARIGSVEVVEFIRETGGRIMPGRAEALSKKFLDRVEIQQWLQQPHVRYLKWIRVYLMV